MAVVLVRSRFAWRTSYTPQSLTEASGHQIQIAGQIFSISKALQATVWTRSQSQIHSVPRVSPTQPRNLWPGLTIGCAVAACSNLEADTLTPWTTFPTARKLVARILPPLAHAPQTTGASGRPQPLIPALAPSISCSTCH